MFSGSCGEAFCDCPSRRAAGCIAYRDILCSPFTAGALAVLLCFVLCLHPPHNTPLTEAGPQQGLDAQQACAGTAEAVVCVEEEAQSGTDPLSLCGGFGYPSVMDLGVGWAWGQMLPLGYSIRSSACVEVVEDPSVLLVRICVTPVPCLHSKSSSCWLPGLPMLWHRDATHLIFLLMCSGSVAVKQLLPRQRGNVERIIIFSI